jgi:hypothetical protein
MSEVYEFVDHSNKVDENVLAVDFHFDSDVTKEEAIETVRLVTRLIYAHKKGTKDYIYGCVSLAKRRAKEFTYTPTIFAISKWKENDDK